MTTPPAVSLGLPGATPAAALRELGRAAEHAGLHALWLNDTPDGDSLAGLAEVAAVTSRLRLATGVIPVDRSGAAAIAARVAELGLPVERLDLGIGSGRAAHPVDAVAAALAELRERTAAALVVGALGPRMRRLAAEHADGVLLSWHTPATARDAGAEALARSAAVGRATPVRRILYTRAAVDPDAAGTLRAEADRYAGYPAYAAHFARLGVAPIATTILAPGPGASGRGDQPGPPELATAVAGYADGVDELVLRAITVDGSVGGVRRLIDAAAAS